MRIRILSCIFAACVLIGCQTPSGNTLINARGEEELPEWISYKRNQVTLLYTSDINPKRLEARLRTRYFTVSAVERDMFTNPSYPVEERIISRLESILLRTEQILSMYPAFMELNIKVFRNRKELNQEHLNIFGTLPNYKTFYVHSLSTIYTSMQDISDSVVSHEMAHAVIDNYFTVIPPEKTAELLAVYVDSHLEKD